VQFILQSIFVLETSFKCRVQRGGLDLHGSKWDAVVHAQVPKDPRTDCYGPQVAVCHNTRSVVFVSLLLVHRIFLFSKQPTPNLGPTQCVPGLLRECKGAHTTQCAD